jgi:hypothetical protein
MVHLGLVRGANDVLQVDGNDALVDEAPFNCLNGHVSSPAES